MRVLNAVCFSVALLWCSPLHVFRWIDSVSSTFRWLSLWFFSLGLVVFFSRRSIIALISGCFGRLTFAQHASFFNLGIVGEKKPVKILHRRQKNWASSLVDLFQDRMDDLVSDER